VQGTFGQLMLDGVLERVFVVGRYDQRSSGVIDELNA
jgi:hypothetical protein